MTIFRHKKATGSLALAALLACSACGSSAPPPPTLRQQVLSIITKTDAVLARDRSAKTPSEVYAKFAVDFERASKEFHALKFPAKNHADAKTLVADLHTMALDATALSKAQAKSQKVLKNVQAEGEATLHLTEAEEAEKKVSNAVRHDVGLPVVTTTTTTTPGLTPLGTTTTAPSTTTSTKG
jgi:type IV secretory pathway VirJ component